MTGALLDTHTLYWLVTGAVALSDDALVQIGECQAAGRLYVSPISAWELALAVRKPLNAPALGDDDVARWFRSAARATASKISPIGQSVAVEAARVVSTTGHKDPGDCFLIATARLRKLSIISRDRAMLELAEPGYLDLIEC
ncbi:MAG: type II toxin-antitoxin system VapC family toxin [Rhizobiales bacterium]|nr:type II toxin-antitoxin system VapC family toxin [Hyphomicrobiales bacterium]